MTISKNHAIHAIFNRIDAEREEQLKRLLQLQKDYVSVMGVENKEVLARGEALRLQFETRRQRLETQYKHFSNLMQVSDTQLQIDNANQRVSFEDDPQEILDAIKTRSVTEDQYWGAVFGSVLDVEDKATLESRITEEIKPFREALLALRPTEQWKNERLEYTGGFYHRRVLFEGKAIPMKRVVQEFISRHFPAEREYSDMAQLNRMVAMAGIERFSFRDSAVLHKMFLSVKTEEEWKDYEPSSSDFDKMNFTYTKSKSLQGQMLMIHTDLEEFNETHGTFYAFMDCNNQKRLGDATIGVSTADKIAKLFERAGIAVSHAHLEEMVLDSQKVKEILLSARGAEEWVSWPGTVEEFISTTFKIPGYRRFSGGMLQGVLEQQQGIKYSVKDVFALAGMEYGTDPAIRHGKLEDRFEKFYGMFTDREVMHHLFLQVQSPEAWATPQYFQGLRTKSVHYHGREITLHTMMLLFGVYENNCQLKKRVEDYVTFADLQKDPALNRYSNKDTLGRILCYGKLDCKWIPDVTEVELGSPTFLRRLLEQGEYDGKTISYDEMNRMGVSEFRKVALQDHETGFTIKGHALMLFYSALPYQQQFPDKNISEIVQRMKLGKSNASVKESIFEATA